MQEDAPERGINYKALGLLAGGVLLIVVIAMIVLHSSGEPATAATEQAQTSTPQPNPAPPVEVAKPRPKMKGCYAGPEPSAYHMTAATRRDFAQDTAQKVQGMVGRDVIYVNTAGDNDQILLFSADPSDGAILRNLAYTLRSNISVKSNFCMQGFAEVQFIIRDSSSNQTLVTKWEPNPTEWAQYMIQATGTKPM